MQETPSDVDSPDLRHRRSHRDERLSVGLLQWLALGLLAFSLGAFLIATPGGVLAKADMVGYAVCHRIGSHSFSLGGRQLPLCARCTGTFTGALVGLVGHAIVLRRRRAAQFPPPAVLATLVVFTLAWVADGANSYLALVGAPHLYPPRNSLRLFTGALNGLTVSALVYPLFNVVLWRDPDPEPTLRGVRDLAVLFFMEFSLVIVVLSRWDPLLYPIALVGATGVLTLLTSVNIVLTLILLRRENSANTWRHAALPVTVGLALSLVQIGAIDLLRYWLTGTLDGLAALP